MQKEYMFEKDGKMKEKYISGTNIIPYCVEDVKKLMKDMEKDIDIEWNKTILPAICEIAYNFMKELIARPATVGDQFQNCFDALDDIKRNINSKFPEMEKQSEKLSSDLLLIWRQEQKVKVRKSLQKGKHNQKNQKNDQKLENIKKKNGKSRNKYQLKDTAVQIKQQSNFDILEQDIDQLLNFLSEEDFSQT